MTTPALPPGPFDLILADPPWRYDFSNSRSRAIERRYATMLLRDIKALPVADMAARNSVLYLWATQPKLPEALEVMKAWGFTYKSGGIWDKRRTPRDRGRGYWWIGIHELLLAGTRGKFSPPPEHLRERSIFAEPRSGRHSQKPECVHQSLERYFPDVRRVELFAREPRPGWTVWGDGVIPMEWVK